MTGFGVPVGVGDGVPVGLGVAVGDGTARRVGAGEGDGRGVLWTGIGDGRVVGGAGDGVCWTGVIGTVTFCGDGGRTQTYSRATPMKTIVIATVEMRGRCAFITAGTSPDRRCIRRFVMTLPSTYRC